jgi:hypothetical protein
MNGRTRVKLYKEIALRDEEFCRLCGALPTERQLVIDHRDNDNDNNSLDNLQFLCRKCNYIKNPRMAGRPLDKCVKSNSTSLSINRTKERQVRKYVMNNYGEDCNYKRLINRTAEIFQLSPVTTKRYLDKMCSSAGIFEKRAGNVKLKEGWEDKICNGDLEILKELRREHEEIEKITTDVETEDE